MFRTLLFICVFVSTTAVFAQDGNSVKLHIKNKDTKAAVADATVILRETNISVTADKEGKAEIRNIPNGEQVIEISFPGYETAELRLTFPLVDTSERIVFLTVNNEVGEVTVSSTRTGREIEAEPTRVEAIDEEEIDEKISMQPANVSMVVAESTGIQVQQTSATSNTQSVRIQGLDGRYTQILKDGYPAFGGFSGSLSLLEIPPLDLRQVEIIKGPSATLYGAGAIGGVVNFISKDPDEKPVTTLVFNQTSALGTDVSAFNSRKFARFGYTLLGSTNYQNEYDVDDDTFTDMPLAHSYGVNPKLFFYIDDKTRFTIGNAFSYQTRTGGDMFAVQGKRSPTHVYFEKNKSLRNVTTASFDRSFDDGSRLMIKQSFAYFSRDLTTPDYRFKGDQFNSYTDAAYFCSVGKNALILGINAVYDRFKEDRVSASPLDRSETRASFGAYVQDTVDLTPRLALEAGFRLDATKSYGAFALPKVSLLYRFSDRFTTRIGYGLGYKTPSVFTEDAEELLFKNVIGIGDTLKAERSRGGTVDFNYRGTIGEKFAYSINQMFFHTRIGDPLVLEPTASGFYRYINETSPIVSRGFETNLKMTYGIAKLFLGYTFTDAKADYIGGTKTMPLIPKSRINSSLVFEKAENFKGGVEAYYSSSQTLSDRTRTPVFTEIGLYFEKIFPKFSIFVNAENLTDVRQSRYGPVVFPPYTAPTFAEIYTHLEGRTFNGGIKIRL